MNSNKFNQRLQEEIDLNRKELLELNTKLSNLMEQTNAYCNALGCKHEIVIQTHRVHHSKHDDLTLVKCNKCKIELEV